MQTKTRRRLHRMAPLALACVAVAPVASAQTYAPWLTQIGLNASIASAANWGQSQLIGIVDTGIAASNIAFAAGQVSVTQSACAAITFRCTNGVADDNGHGTAVAAIAAGNRRWTTTNSYGGYTVVANSYVGVAPNANIVAEKVLAANGSGTNLDVVNGINRAAAAGASVINLSLTYMNSPDIVTAINNATAKGAFIVWAGGNSAANLLANANTTGLTQNAINHLLFAGSVNSANNLSSFSNKPGTGNLMATTGAKTTYSSRWVMAPGENILAPGVQYGPTAYAYWSGTSMSAPVVSGALALLQSAWPILRTNGSTANLMLATTTDLGTKGVDANYGSGLVNLTTAFQPYGTLTVTGANGGSLAVPNITSALLSSGALGSLAAIKSKLASYTAFDGYQRNFSVNLSGLIASPTAKATLNPLPANVNAGPTKVKLAEGGEFAFSLEAPPPAAAGLDSAAALAGNTNVEGRRNGYMMFTDRAGTTMAMGYGVPVRHAFAMSLYGDDELARASSSLDVSGFADMVQGGAIASFGVKLGTRTRFAASYGGSNPFRSTNPLQFVQSWSSKEASAVTMGLSHRFDGPAEQGITAGVTYTSLEEKHGMLGGVYDTQSAVSLGDKNLTHAIGLSAAIATGHNSALLVESQWAATEASSGAGLLAGTQGVRSRGFGLSYTKRSWRNEDDRVTASVRQPLRVVAGQAGVVTAGVDELGRAQYRTDWTSMVPDGRELDYRLSYDMPAGRDKSLSLQFAVKRDFMNMAGNNDASAGVMWRAKF